MTGTATSVENSDMFFYPSITVCSEDTRAHVIGSLPNYGDLGGFKLFDSGASVHAFMETNILKPYVIPAAPDMAEMLLGIWVNGPDDTKFTFHTNKQNKHYKENRDTFLSLHPLS